MRLAYRPSNPCVRPIMNEVIANLYAQMRQCVEAADIQGLKNIYLEQFDLLCKPDERSADFLHGIMEAERYDILQGIIEAFDEHFRQADLSPFHKENEALIRKGFFDQPNSENENLLLLAARNSQETLVNGLLDNHANVNQTSIDLSSPLLEATEEENAAIIQVLIDHGADVRQQNAHGLMPFDVACRKAQPMLMLTLAPGKKAAVSTPTPELQPDHSLEFIELAEKEEYEAIEIYLDGLAAQSADHKVKVSAEMLQSTQGKPKLFKLLIQYKNGFVCASMPHGNDAIGAVEDHGAQHLGKPGETVELVGIPLEESSNVLSSCL